MEFQLDPWDLIFFHMPQFFETIEEWSPSRKGDAVSCFETIITHFSQPKFAQSVPYDRVKLVELTYKSSNTGCSKRACLDIFYRFTLLEPRPDALGLDSPESEDSVRFLLFAFADLLLEKLYIPLVDHDQILSETAPGWMSRAESDRLCTLHRSLMEREAYRCSISRTFSKGHYLYEMAAEKRERETKGCSVAHMGKPERSKLLKRKYGVLDPFNNTVDGSSVSDLQVTTIVPRCVAKSRYSELEKLPFSRFLDLLDYRIASDFTAQMTYKPNNALLLTGEMAAAFKSYKVYVKPILGKTKSKGRECCIDSFVPNRFPGVMPTNLVFNTTFNQLHGEKNLNVKHRAEPDSRFLSFHAAVGHVLHYSGAGNHIDQLLAAKMSERSADAEAGLEQRFADINM